MKTLFLLLLLFTFSQQNPEKMVLVSNPDLGYDFWIDTHEVTMAEFERFQLATGYQTTCERRGTGPKSYRDQSFRALRGLELAS